MNEHRLEYSSVTFGLSSCAFFLSYKAEHSLHRITGLLCSFQLKAKFEHPFCIKQGNEV